MADENEKETRPEVKYSADFYVRDLITILTMVQEKAKLIREIEFSNIQKTQIAGTMMAMGTTHQLFVNRLKEWGFLL